MLCGPLSFSWKFDYYLICQQIHFESTELMTLSAKSQKVHAEHLGKMFSFNIFNLLFLQYLL